MVSEFAKSPSTTCSRGSQEMEEPKHVRCGVLGRGLSPESGSTYLCSPAPGQTATPGHMPPSPRTMLRSRGGPRARSLRGEVPTQGHSMPGELGALMKLVLCASPWIVSVHTISMRSASLASCLADCLSSCHPWHIVGARHLLAGLIYSFTCSFTDMHLLRTSHHDRNLGRIP